MHTIKSRFISNARGVTLPEMLMVISILGILFMAIVPVMRVTQSSYTSMEMTNSLKTVGQRSMNQISSQLTECKRLFENNATGTAFLGRVGLSTSPAVMTGSLLPSIEETGSISPSTSTFVAASVGNSLFFANLNPPRDYTVVDSGGVSRNVRIDLYTFHYYYLSETTSKLVATQSQRRLWHWWSVDYADYGQITALTDNTTKTNTILALRNNAIYYAFNTPATTVTSGFYLLTSSGGLTLDAGHTIQISSYKEMISILTGTTGTGYRYGVSPNNSGLGIRQVVPGFGVANSRFPSGFEVVVVGSNSVRQIFMRMVLVAQGARKGYVSHEEQILTTVRDLW